MKKAVLVLLCIVAVSSFGLVPAAAGPALKPVLKLISSTNIVTGSAMYAAVPITMGYYKEEGLDVSLQWVDGSATALQMLAAGKADIIHATADLVMAARQKGSPVKLVDNLYHQAPFFIAVPEDSPIKTVADLKGKTIGVPSLASSPVPHVKGILASAGLDWEKDIQSLIAVGTGAQAAAALSTKKVDAIGLWNEACVVIEAMTGMKFRRFYAPYQKDFIFYGLVVRDDTIAKDPQLVIGMCRAISKSILFCLTNPEAAVKIHYKMYPQSKPIGKTEEQALEEGVRILLANVSLMNPEYSATKRWAYMTARQFEVTQDFFFNNKVLTAKLDPKEYFTDQFVDAINDFDAAQVIKQAKEYKD